MSKIVQGKDCVVFKWNVSLSVWVPYACARSSTITITTDVLETSITGSGKYRTFLPVANSFTGSIEGLMQLMKTNTVSIADLIALQLAHTVLLMRFVNENEEGDIFTMEANFYLTSSGITSSFDNVNTFSCELKGTGPLTLIYTPTPVISGRMNRKEFTLPLSDDSIVITELIGVDAADLISVEIDGMERPIIITTGTPLGQEVKFTTGTGTLQFPSANIDNDLYGHCEYQT